MTCLIDNGARVNLVTLEFVRERGLGVGSIQDLSGHNGRIPLSGLGGKITEPLGYVMFQVQIPHVPSYGEDQVALIVVEDSHFLKKCQVVLGTPTINRAVRVMKESEMEATPEAWRSAQHTYEFANFMIQLNPEDYGMPMPTNTGENPTDLDELVLLKNKVTIPAFESIFLHCRTRRTMMMGYKLHVMTQASYPEDRANLPNGVYVVKTYTELHDGSCSVSVVLRNLTGKPVHLPAGRPVALQFERMLMEHHNIFSLERNEIGCTDAAEHVIELLDTEPFKEHFHRMAPPLVEEVREHLQEMLDGGAIRLSQSPWCNAVVLV